MARLITPTYVFAPSASPNTSTIDLSAISGFNPNAIAGIINNRTGGTVYGRGFPGYLYTANNAGVLTLQAALPGMLANDPLAIRYDDNKVALQVGGADVAAGNSLPVALPADQDPILDHANGQKTSVVGSTIILVPPAGCKYARIAPDVDILVRTDGVAPTTSDGFSARIYANQPETIPVIAGTNVLAVSASDAANVVAIPYKVRS